MAEDKLRYNDVNMKWTPASHNLSGYHSNSLIVLCFIHLHYLVEPKWMLADHSLNQLLFKLKVLATYIVLETFGMFHNHLGLCPR